MGSNIKNKKHVVVIVDDEAAIVDNLKDFLESDILDVKAFTNAREAYEWAKDNAFDVLISDLKMNFLNGLELHEKLKVRYPNILTILMTGYSSFDTAQKAIASSIYAYVSKPFQLEEMKRHVERALEKKNLLDRNRQLVEEQQQLIEKLLAANKELKKLDQMKSDFVSTVSHELRTPLTSIKNLLYNLLNGIVGPVSDGQTEYLKMIRADGERLENLISDILNLSQLETGRYQLKLSDFKIREALDPVVKFIRQTAQEKEIEIIEDIDEAMNDTLIHADRSKIEQVLMNLISNAVKYLGSGKRVRITVKRSDNSFKISIQDEGVGISPEDQRRIFKRFERADGSFENGIQGTGLGLSIVKKILDLHSGRIFVSSAAGKGSTFTIEMPIIVKHKAQKGVVR